MTTKPKTQKRVLKTKTMKHHYNILPSGNAILRGSKSQAWEHYSTASQGNQDIANCFAAFALHKTIPINSWYYKHIDLVLDVGDQLFQDSYITYAPIEDPKLGFKNILRNIYIEQDQVSLKVCKPILNDSLTPSNLVEALIRSFQEDRACILSANEEYVGVFFKQGFYYMFDPHSRDLEGGKCSFGSACVIRFRYLQNLVARFIENVGADTKLFDIHVVRIAKKAALEE